MTNKNIDTQIDEFENQISELNNQNIDQNAVLICLLYTSDAADE